MSVLHPTKFPEVTTLSVMRNLKKTNEHNKMLQERINSTIDMLESFYIANPSEASAKMLLEANKLHERTKCVAKREFDDGSKPDYIHRSIKDGNFDVAITAGRKVRYVPTPDVIDNVRCQFHEMPGELTFYE